MVQFALSGLLAFTVVAIVGVGLLRTTARTEALRDAKNETRLAGEGIVQPVMTDAALDGDPAALRKLDRVVRQRVLQDPVVRVKIWSPSGTILYSDEPRLIGERYPLELEEWETMRTAGIQAEISDLSSPDNRFERPFKELREVYLGVTAPSGRRVLFELYLRNSSIASNGHQIWSTFAPVLLGAMLLLWITQLPLAFALAKRLRRGEAERVALLQAAVDASEQERQRIARDLHDGVVQELAGASFAVGAAAQHAERDPAATRRALGAVGDQIRHSMRQLRTLLLDLYPDSLHRQGLEGAMNDLLARAEQHAIATSLAIATDPPPTAEAEAVIYRTTQEALRNVVRHAGASNVHVTLGPQNGDWVLRITDDGRGFERGSDDRPRFGLRMLEDLAREHDGELSIRSGPAEGTAVTLTLPRTR